MKRQDMINALEYFEMWVENDIGIYDDLAKHRRVAYECIKECLNQTDFPVKCKENKKKIKERKIKNDV